MRGPLDELGVQLAKLGGQLDELGVQLAKLRGQLAKVTLEVDSPGGPRVLNFES